MDQGKHIRLLFIVKAFAQGHGGGPESVRMMARWLDRLGVVADVYDGRHLTPNIARLDFLPRKSGEGAQTAPVDLSVYDHVVNIGPWNSPGMLFRLLRQKAVRTAFWYMPKGGLCRVEFRRAKGKVKLLYFMAVELLWLSLAKRLIFSSRLERDNTVLSRLFRGKSRVVPDFFSYVPQPELSVAGRGADAPVTLSFLAEIDPRKGLMEAVAGVLAWAGQAGSAACAIRLVIAGNVRAGRKDYFEKVQALVQAAPFPVTFIGPVSHEDKSQFYRDTDIFLCTSQFESFGLTLLEALASGCEVVASRNLGVLEYTGHPDRVHVCEDLTPSAIARTLDAAYGRVSSGTRQAGATEQEGETCISGVNSRALDGWRSLLAVAGDQA